MTYRAQWGTRISDTGAVLARTANLEGSYA
jgi:hypothetical protein